MNPQLLAARMLWRKVPVAEQTQFLAPADRESRHCWNAAASSPLSRCLRAPLRAMEVGQPQSAYKHYKKFRRLVKKNASRGIAVAPVSHSPSSSFSQSGDAFDEALAFARWSVGAGAEEEFADPLSSAGKADNGVDDLVETASSVVLFCKGHARKILRRRFAAGICKPLVLLGMMRATRWSSMKEGSRLVSYAAFNALAIRKIEISLAQGQSSGGTHAIRTKLSSIHAEILHSPLLLELIAAHVDHRPSLQGRSKPLPPGFQEFSCDFDGVKPTLSCVTLDSFRLDFELSCSICLDTFFCPVALSCGHIFCHSCACCTASVPAFQGLELAKRSAKCPLCRQMGVYQDATDLLELTGLIKHRCKAYWQERSRKERAQQLQEIKDYYNQELRAVMGYTDQ